MKRWNIGETWGTASYLILSEKLIEPEFERRSDYDIIARQREQDADIAVQLLSILQAIFRGYLRSIISSLHPVHDRNFGFDRVPGQSQNFGHELGAGC